MALPATGAYHDSVPDHQPRWGAEVRQAVPRSNFSCTVIPAGCRNPVPWVDATSVALTRTQVRLNSHLHSPVSKLSEIALTRGRACVHRRVAEQTFKRLGLEKTI